MALEYTWRWLPVSPWLGLAASARTFGLTASLVHVVEVLYSHVCYNLQMRPIKAALHRMVIVAPGYQASIWYSDEIRAFSLSVVVNNFCATPLMSALLVESPRLSSENVGPGDPAVADAYCQYVSLARLTRGRACIVSLVHWGCWYSARLRTLEAQETQYIFHNILYYWVYVFRGFFCTVWEWYYS